MTVKLGAVTTSATVYDPTIGVEPVRTLTNVNSIELTLSDHPVIIAIPPGTP